MVAGRKKAKSLKEGVSTRGDHGATVPDINEIRKALTIRFEVQADTPAVRVAVEAHLKTLRGEFPEFKFEAVYGVKP